MLQMLHTEPSLADRFLSHMLARNIRIEEDLIDHLFNSSEKRLARALLLLARYGKEDQPLRLPKMSQEMLAEMVGTTRSRINFFMNKFRKLGFIEYNGDIKVNRSLMTVVLHDDAFSPGCERSFGRASTGGLSPAARRSAWTRWIWTSAVSFAVALEESELPKVVHQRVDLGPGRPAHLGQEVPRDFRQRVAYRRVLVEVREQQERTREALFAAVEDLVDQVLFDADVSQQHVGPKPIGEGRFLEQPSPHLCGLHDGDRAAGHGFGGGLPAPLPGQRSLAEERAGMEHGHDGGLAAGRTHRQASPDPSRCTSPSVPRSPCAKMVSNGS